VLQRDVLPPTATVREALSISALLKLPRSMTKAEKLARVDAVLKELELEDCQNTLVGDELIGMKVRVANVSENSCLELELIRMIKQRRFLVFMYTPAGYIWWTKTPTVHRHRAGQRSTSCLSRRTHVGFGL
jgi:hypothetical protein